MDGKRRSQRRYTTYQNCPLPTSEERLLFVMSYVKGNPLQSNHGLLFGMKQGKTNTWLHVLLPVLQEILRQLGVAPSRSVSQLAQRLAFLQPLEHAVLSNPEAPLPLFAMMSPSDPLSAPKLTLNRPLVGYPLGAARKKTTP